MKKVTLVALVVIGGLIMGLSARRAEALSFDLNCTLSGTGCASSFSYGTVSLTDNGNTVDLKVDLGGSGIHKVQSIYLNYDDSLFSNTSAFTSSAGEASVDENKKKAGGYSAGKFDIQISKKGNIGFEPYLGTLSLSGFDLNPSHFDFKDSSGLLFAAVHIGNIACASVTCIGTAGENSVWVGSTSRITLPPPPPAPVPEPATLILLGAGMMGLFTARKSQKQQ